MNKCRPFSNQASKSGKLVKLALYSLLVLVALMQPGQAQELRLDPKLVMGPDECGECHKASVAAYTQSLHRKSFREITKKTKMGKSAKKIAKKMGIKRLKKGSACVSCHFTAAEVKGRVKVIGGVTCETCHGAARNFIKVHSDYGGKSVTRETETPEHRTERWAKSEAAGMIRPVRLYTVAENCFQCHTVPNEKLVNVGGHSAGSKDFELVAWSQGEVRHQVWYTKTNDETPVDRRRMMFAVGQGLNLEYAMRGLANATGPGVYGDAMKERATKALAMVEKVSSLLSVAELGTVAGLGKTAKLEPGNGDLTGRADQIKAALKTFTSSYDGSKFAALDAMLPKPEAYKGEVTHPK